MESSNDVELLIGYSFGISPTSAPGALNERIAQHIEGDLRITDGRRFVGVQWEIEDALRSINPHHSRDFVVAPPFFKEEDVKDLFEKERINRFLFDQFKGMMLNHVDLKLALEAISLHPNLGDTFTFRNRTVSYLNRLLHDTGLFKRFGSIKLPSETKEKNGRKWEESREIPPPDSPDLATYQAQRLNRLILESIVPVLPKAKYLVTIDVADAVLRDVHNRGLSVARVRIYGHPAHVARCRVQTLESAWKIGMRLDASQVDAKPCGDDQNLDAPENWDPNNAQEWVRSWELWTKHEGIETRI